MSTVSGQGGLNVTHGPRVAILADDLTSAADGSGPFVRAGASATLVLQPMAHAPTDVVAVDLDTRHRGPAGASERTGLAVRSYVSAPVLLKTVDSTLRGNVGAEIMAATRAAHRELTVVVPAFPFAGRTTRGAVQLLDGVPVHQTSFGADPMSPVSLSNLSLIVPGARRLEGHEDWADLRGVWLADAETDADLDELVARVRDPGRVLWVGSPGLAGALSRASSFSTTTPLALPPAGRVLVVVGSRHAASRAQLDTLTCGRPIDARSESLVAQTARALTDRGWAAVANFAENSTASESDQRLAGMAVELARSRAFDAVIATGGATARALVEGLDIVQIDVVAEPEPGVVAGVARGGGYPFVVVLKAGGFGDETTLFRLLHLVAPAISCRELA